jgi:hypothetical protein
MYAKTRRRSRTRVLPPPCGVGGRLVKGPVDFSSPGYGEQLRDGWGVQQHLPPPDIARFAHDIDLPAKGEVKASLFACNFSIRHVETKCD